MTVKRKRRSPTKKSSLSQKDKNLVFKNNYLRQLYASQYKKKTLGETVYTKETFEKLGQNLPKLFDVWNVTKERYIMNLFHVDYSVIFTLTVLFILFLGVTTLPIAYMILLLGFSTTVSHFWKHKKSDIIISTMTQMIKQYQASAIGHALLISGAVTFYGIFCLMNVYNRNLSGHDMLLRDPGEFFVMLIQSLKTMGSTQNLRYYAIIPGMTALIRFLLLLVDFTVLAEPICLENVCPPIMERNGDSIWKKYERMQNGYWRETEIETSEDHDHWETEGKIPKELKYLIAHIHAFFFKADIVVMDAINRRFMSLLRLPAAIATLTTSSFQEVTHTLTYKKIIDVVAPTPEKQKKLLERVDTDESIRMKIDLTQRYLAGDEFNIAKLIIVMCANEGIGFATSFQILYWLKTQKLMPGACQANRLISTDEFTHCSVWLDLYKKLLHKLPQKEVHQIFLDYVICEFKFLENGMKKGKINGLPVNDIKLYIMWWADHWIKKLGYEPMFNSENRLPWSKMNNMMIKINFFEHQNTEYNTAQAESRQLSAVDANGNATRVVDSNKISFNVNVHDINNFIIRQETR